jgi:hypothetical protein
MSEGNLNGEKDSNLRGHDKTELYDLMVSWT